MDAHESPLAQSKRLTEEAWARVDVFNSALNEIERDRPKPQQERRQMNRLAQKGCSQFVERCSTVA